MSKHRSWIIGRAPDCDLVVLESAVSWKHCRLSQTDHGFFLEEIQSSNGTFVNDVRITGKTRVQPGDRITLGLTVPLPWPALATPAPAPALRLPATRSGAVRIGRAADNDVVLDYPMISAHHARILLDDQLRIEDLGSTNGTAIGQPNAKVSAPVPISSSDTVYFGSLRIPVARLLTDKVTLGNAVQLTVAFRGQPIVFGRDPACDQILDAPMISWRHARLSGTTDSPIIEDLGSANGTYVNGKRVRGRAGLKPGDIVGLGSFTFQLTGSGALEKRDFQGNVTIEVRSIRVDVPGKRLLEGISLSIYPSEFVGLMGPSGAGKTTLMNVLNGYTPPTSGEVLLNGQSLYENYDQFRTHIGYVPQDDIIHRDLTVGEALRYTARLRLPTDLTGREIGERTRQVLQQLGLEAVENVLVGSPERKGISGGQRKRVNLAMELLTDPLVLFLDEPTSGLSSEDALMVMKLLRGLADSGKTILLTIHQPSLDAYRLMDNLVMVAKDPGTADPGMLAYYGPAYPDAIHFFNPDGLSNKRPGIEPSPDEVLKGLKKLKTGEWASRFQRSPYHREYVAERSGTSPAADRGPVCPRQEVPFDLQRWFTLLERGIVIKLRDSWHSAVLMLQAPIVAMLLMFVFGSQPMADTGPYPDWARAAGSVGMTLFLLTLAALWFGCSNAIREIVGEWAIYRRERMVNLTIPSYIGSKLAVLGGLCVIQCAILLGITYWGCELMGPWPVMLLFLVLVSFVGVALGLALSAFAKTSEMAVGLLPIVLVPMVILGGALKPIHQMPAPIRIVSHFVPLRWAFEGMLLLENNQRPQSPPKLLAAPGAMIPPDAAPRSDIAEDFFPGESHRMGVIASTAALAILWIVFVVGTHVILRCRDVH